MITLKYFNPRKDEILQIVQHKEDDRCDAEKRFLIAKAHNYQAQLTYSNGDMRETEAFNDYVWSPERNTWIRIKGVECAKAS